MRTLCPRIALLLLALLFGATVAARAATITVNSTADPAASNPLITIPELGSTVTLRDAVNAAHNSGGTHTITFAPSLAGQTIYLSRNQGNVFLNLSGSTAANITIQGLTGASGVTIARDPNGPQLTLLSTTSPNLTLTVNDLTFTGGNTLGNGGAINIFGGATVNLNRCTLTGNTAFYYGGAIAVTNSTLNVTNCTIAGNTSLGANGAVGGGIWKSGGSLTLTHTTIANNVNFGLYSEDGGDLLVNTIVAGNSRSGVVGPGDLGQNGGFASISASSHHNLIGDARQTNVVNGVNGNIVADPLLKPLGTYGSSIRTMALSANSPAVDAGGAGVASTDQRGISRPQGAGVDIGAFERVPGEPTAFSSAASTSFVVGVNGRFAVAADGTPSPTFSVSGALPAGVRFDATGLFIGSPNPGTEGTYPLTITASNGAGFATQNFTLTVVPVIVVTTATDEDNGSTDPAQGTGTSLREAINYANEQLFPQTITVAPNLAGQSINLTIAGVADPNFGPIAFRITNDITIVGPAGNGGITLRRAVSGDLLGFQVLAGGALTLSDATIADFQSHFFAAILNSGTLRLNRCTLRNNTSRTFGAGLYNASQATLNNCTIANNQARLRGAGIETGPNLTLTNVTITGNTATEPNNNFGREGSGIAHGSGIVLINCIVVGNTSGSSPSDLNNSTGNTLVSPGSRHNIIGAAGDIGMVNGVNGNQVGVSPNQVLLGSLGNYGGPTQTIPLQPGSPAMEAGVPMSDSLTDQRGVLRGASGGLRGRYYAIPGGATTALLSPLSNLEALKPFATVLTPRVDFGAGTETLPGDGTVLNRGSTNGNPFGGSNVNVGTDHIAAVWDGFITVPETATYRFTTRSDDGSALYINGQLVVNNNFLQGVTNRSGTVALPAGQHRIRIAFFDASSGAVMQASWEQLDGASPFSRQIIPPSVLSFGNSAGVLPAPDIGAFEFTDFQPQTLVTTGADEDNGTADPRFGAGTSLREAVRFAQTPFTSTGFGVNGAAWILNGSSVSVSSPFGTLDDVLTITPASAGQRNSAWLSRKVNVNSFTATFRYTQNAGADGADGFTFTLQNTGLHALGASGGGLGYGGIGQSVAFAFNIYNSGGSVVPGFAVYTNGNVTGTYTPVGNGVSLTNGQPVDITIAVTDTTATLTMTQGANVFTTTFNNLNIASIVGGNTAYAGFTGATGGAIALQQISRFNVTAAAPLAATIAFAPALAGQTINVAAAAGSADEWDTSSAFSITGNITLNGLTTSPGVILGIDAAVALRHFVVRAGASLTLSNLTLAGGKPQLANFNRGGAISAFGNLTARNCTFIGNTSPAEGGAIQNWPGAASLVLENCTFSGNSGGTHASAISANGTQATLTHLTITNNTAPNSAVVLWGTQATMVNSILTGNANDDVLTGNGGTFTAQSTNNLLGDSSTPGLTHGSNGNLLGVPVGSLLFASLSNNGGPTPTVALQPGSLAIDAGTSIAGLTADQRGTARPQGAAVDIGAFELVQADAAIPIMGPLGGLYQGSVQVSIASTSTGAAIRYTLDGSTPSPTNGLLYTAPFTLTQTATVKAIAYGAGWLPSPVASASYTVLAPLPWWRNLHGLAADGSQDLANPSGDGVANLLKYAFNMAPNAGDLALPNTAVLPENGTAGLPFIDRNAQGRLVIEFIRRKATTNPGVSYVAETGDDLTDLQLLDLSGATVESIDPTWERVTVTDPASTPKRFGRVRIQSPGI